MATVTFDHVWKKYGDVVAVNADGGLAFGNLGDFGAKAAPAVATWDALSTGIAQCSNVAPAGSLSWTDGQALSFTLTPAKAGVLF